MSTTKIKKEAPESREKTWKFKKGDKRSSTNETKLRKYLSSQKNTSESDK